VVKEAVASAVSVEYEADTRGVAQFGISVVPNPGEGTERAEQALRQFLKKRGQSGISVKYVDDAKKRLIRDAIFARDSLMMPGYAFGTALSIGKTVRDVEEWPARINAITVSQVNEALRSLLTEKHQMIAQLLPDPYATEKDRVSTRDAARMERSIR
jgi:zinc protease